MEIIRDFEKISKNDSDLAGGKGASLGEMTQADIPVPPGFVVLSAAFDRFLHETDLTQEIDAILKTVDHNAINTVEDASEKIRGLIESREMPKDISDEIKKDFKKLDSKFVAVRSSATAEDGSEHAWAGQLESFLNTTEESLLTNVRKCWGSLFTPRAIFYRFEKGLHGTEISVAVVVQKMIQSEVSGIAFSVHPITEDPNQLIIEAGYGLGEAIVSGSITPDSYVVEKELRNIIDKNISEQKKAFVKDGKDNNWVMVDKEKRNNQKLSDEKILDLSELVVKIEKHYNFPCDIEWAFEENKFYIVQSRPITTLKNNRYANI
ncbi:MAG: PEP/pyruvate-binding domain-containing protein [Candidatus Paceibacterota bacterium]|jgi:pyruvate,water dikinase